MATFFLPTNSKVQNGKSWMKHSLAWTDVEKKKVTLGYRPVHEFTLSKDVDYIKPKARVY